MKWRGFVFDSDSNDINLAQQKKEREKVCLWTIEPPSILKNQNTNVWVLFIQVTGNKMTSLNLATIFGPNLLHKQKSTDKEFSVQSSARAEESTAIIAVVQKMIENYEMLFIVSRPAHTRRAQGTASWLLLVNLISELDALSKLMNTDFWSTVIVIRFKAATEVQ